MGGNCRLTDGSFGTAADTIPAFLSRFSRVVRRPRADRPLRRQSSCSCAVVSCRKMAAPRYIFVCEFPSPGRVVAVRLGGIMRPQVI